MAASSAAWKVDDLDVNLVEHSAALTAATKA